MVTCDRCNGLLADDALFCPKCGVRTAKGRKEKAEIPWEESLEEVRKKVDEAVTLAFEEMRKGLETARKEINKSTSRETVTCPQCGEESSVGAQFCWGCGKKIR